MSFTAQCACKRVSITLVRDPVRCFVCHCDYCQRITGSVGVAAALFSESDVEEIAGEFREFDPQLANWPGTKRYNCVNCGAGVHWVNPVAFPSMRLVALGCNDDPSRWEIARVVQNQYRPKWCPALVAGEHHDVYGS